MSRAEISPEPPFAVGVGLPWDVPVDDAVQAIADARSAHGDTFVVESGRDRILFTFSATGVESFYALPEDIASKGVADYLMLRRKLPDAIFDGRRMLPGSLFRRDDVTGYLNNLESALAATAGELGDGGYTDVFALTRRLGHRMGLASWAGPEASRGDVFEELVGAFDALDGADAFVHPDTLAAVSASGKADETAALERIVELVGQSIDDADPRDHPLFARIVAGWADEPSAVARIGIAHDVALIHIASLSNLGAALAWTLIDLIEHPDIAAAVAAGGRELAARCALESTRLAQRSIMARTVLKPVDFDTGDVTFAVGPGATIATLLPLTNRSPELGHDTWSPSRWTRNRFTDTAQLASAQLVTAFGHGKHTCPAQPFSISAMTMASTYLLSHYELTPGWTARPQPVAAQIGGVARASGPCQLTYRRRDVSLN